MRTIVIGGGIVGSCIAWFLAPDREVVVIERNGSWVRVFANTDTPDEQAADQKPEFSSDDTVPPASGWIHDKGIVTPATANGDAILYGTAANFEEQAEQPHAPKDAATEAHLLYRRVAEYFPNSPLAAEARFRSADVRWQLDKARSKSGAKAKASACLHFRRKSKSVTTIVS